MMTEDTRRALEIITPIADELGVDISADDGMLYAKWHDRKCGIGISCNSTYATVMEFVGYLFLVMYDARFRPVNLSPKQKDTIKRYMFTAEQLEKMKEA